MTARHRCSGKIWSDNLRDVNGRVYKCHRPATVQHDGQWYCWQHDPIRVEVDKKKRRTARLAKMDGLYARRARNAKLATLVTPELAALLERLAEIMPAWGDWLDHCADLDEARTQAARIREALARVRQENAR